MYSQRASSPDLVESQLIVCEIERQQGDDAVFFSIFLQSEEKSPSERLCNVICLLIMLSSQVLRKVFSIMRSCPRQMQKLVEPMENCGAGGEVEQFEELEGSSRGKRTSKHA